MREMTSQQERFLIFDIRKAPKTYAKAAIVQCLAKEFNLKHDSIARVMGVSKQYVNNCTKGINVTSWEDRPEKDRLRKYLAKKVKDAFTPIRLFLIEETSKVIYVMTDNGELPDDSCYILYESYLTHQRRKDIRYKVRAGNYKEVDIILTPYHNLTVKEILKHAK